MKSENFVEHLNSNKNLEDIIDEIKESEFIPDLEDNWDGMGAKKIDYDLWEESVKFLYNFSKSISEEYGVKLKRPLISPCPDNSIDIYFHGGPSILLMNIHKDGKCLFSYYGENFYDKNSKIKGKDLHLSTSKDFLYWVKENLKNTSNEDHN